MTPYLTAEDLIELRAYYIDRTTTRLRAGLNPSNTVPRLLVVIAALREAASEVVRLGNQPGMDDDEWEAAMTALERALP